MHHYPRVFTVIQSKNSNHLPKPDPAAAAHSEKVKQHILAEIREHGSIPFARFMELALYAPGLGYYSAGAHKFGAGGDFVTAPEISPLFSRCLARQCQQVLAEIPDSDILELGAGTGIMAADILLELEKLNTLPSHYYILEISAELKQRQQALLQQKIPHLINRVTWLESLAHFKMCGIVIANEVIDALPIYKFKMTHQLQEFSVTEDNGEFIWKLTEPDHLLAQQVAKLNISLPENYESEINLMLQSWLAAISDVLTQGVVLLMDYGFPRHEYYHPDRSMGTLMCHYRHHAHSDPLILVGIQDITAHVDFTHVAEAAEEAKLTVAGYTTQANFLLSCDITALAHSDDDFQQLQYNQQIKKLLLPNEMGELFKVIALTRNLNIPLQGFNLYDMCHKL